MFFFCDKELQISWLYAFDSNDAAMMTGKWLDVAVNFKVIALDCINHGPVLAVACFRHNNLSQAVQVNPSNFYQICAVHMSSLCNIQLILNALHIKN